MAKQPYIPFYLGDYIKDTRILPLNVKGGWVDLILAMWDNEPKGELIGTIEDFARIMNCSNDEANLVIQTLKQKKLFDYSDFGASGELKIVSRKQKKMVELSQKRRDAGNQGGNPKLVKQKDKLIPEYENEYENEIKNEDKERGVGKGVENLIIPQMCSVWYSHFPIYTADKENDFAGMGKILQFIYRQAPTPKSIQEVSTQEKIINTLHLIADQVEKETFWVNKPIKSIANNIQEFYNHIKNPLNGKSGSDTTGGKYSGSYKTAGQDKFADRLKGKVEKKFKPS